MSFIIISKKNSKYELAHRMTAQIHLIDTAQAYLQTIEHLKSSEIYFLDTEFIRERTYRPVVALIQIAVNDQDAYLIDPTFDGFDPTPLIDILNSPTKKIILHSARQDLEIFYFHYNFIPHNLIDTQIMAAALGYGDQIGFEGLVKTILDHELDKSQQRTDWLQRPLSEKQKKYAAADVIYLAKIYPFLQGALEAQGRQEWVIDEIEQLKSPDIYNISDKMLLKKIRHKLNGHKPIATLRELAILREDIAIKRDRIRTLICPDHVLISLAEKRPKTIEKLKTMKNLKHSFVEKYADEILVAINKADQTPPPPPTPPNTRLTIPQERLVNILSIAADATSSNFSVARRLFATSSDISEYVKTNQARFLLGWRHELFGKIVEDILAGTRGLYYHNGQIVIKNN